MLWPADDPWPTCQQPHDWLERLPLPPEITSWDQAVQWAQGSGLSVGREGDGPIFAERHRYQFPELPSPLAGVLQLYAGDVADLPFPDDTDLFQLLWCPNNHGEPWWGPCPITVWRRAAEVTELLAAPPAPRLDDDWFARTYVPLPCELHPEPVIEYPDPCPVPADYPHRCGWPAGLSEQVQEWDDEHEGLYWAALSVAPGTKVGGHPRWIQLPEWPVCGCGRPMDHLLTIASEEFGNRTRWLPWEDREAPTITSGKRSIVDRDAWAPHGLMLGDVGSLYLFTCTACAERPLVGTMQCS